MTGGGDMSGRGEKPDEFFLLTHYLSRRLAYPLAVLFRELGVSANAVTILGGASWLLSVPAVLAGGWLLPGHHAGAGWALLLGAGVLWNLGYILDVADGSLARLTHAASPAGSYLDYCVHLVFQPMFLCSIGAALFLATGRVSCLVVGILSICANWGVSFSAKEHVLCEGIATGKTRVEDLAAADRRACYLDSPKSKASIQEKARGWSAARHLAEEIVCFPGQFSLFSVIVAADGVVYLARGALLPLTSAAFWAVTIVMLVRVPFRIAREYRTLRSFQKLIDPDSLRPETENSEP